MCPLAEYNEPYCKALQNPLIASTVCNYISALLPEAKNSVLERGLLLMSQDHPIASYRLPLLRALISNASDSLVWKELHSIWSEASHPLLSENDYMTLAWELAIRNPQQQQEIIAAQSAVSLIPTENASLSSLPEPLHRMWRRRKSFSGHCCRLKTGEWSHGH